MGYNVSVKAHVGLDKHFYGQKLQTKCHTISTNHFLKKVVKKLLDERLCSKRQIPLLGSK